MLKRLVWMVALTFVVPGSVLEAAAGGSEPVTIAMRGEIDVAVRRMAASIAADLSRDGPTAWIRYFDDDPRFLMAADGKLQFDGIAAARSFLSDFGKRITHVELTWTDVRVDPLAPGVATLAASYREALTDTQGHTMRPNGYFTGVAVRRADGWKLQSLHWSSPAAAE